MTSIRGISAVPHSATRPTQLYVYIEANPEPDVFAQVASVFNIANTAPRRASAHREEQTNW
jgi:hypothetical protein